VHVEESTRALLGMRVVRARNGVPRCETALHDGSVPKLTLIGAGLLNFETREEPVRDDQVVRLVARDGVHLL